VGLTVLALGASLGCTPSSPTPQPSPSQVSMPSQPSAAPTPGTPTMTEIVSAPRCTTRTQSAGLALEEVFPGSTAGDFGDLDEVRPGPDAAEPALCPGELPESAWCDQSVPWTGLPFATFVVAAGATTAQRQDLGSYPTGSPVDENGNIEGARSLHYEQLNVRRGDPRGLLPYLRAAFAKCADARPAVVAGRTALVGHVTSLQGYAVPTEVVLITGSTSAVWVQLAGDGWDALSRDRAARAVLAFGDR
jgi:hypothetical protein